MGLFGSSGTKKSKSAANPNGDAIYFDMEANGGLPVAVAVPESPQNSVVAASAPPTTLSPLPSPSAPAMTMTPTLCAPNHHPEKHLQPMSKQQALQLARVNQQGVATVQQTIFVSRTPTLLPHCPCCGSRNVRTRTRTAPSFVTWVAVVALAFVFWPLCWIPLVTDTCRQTFHYCNHCNAEVGHIRAFQDCCVKHR